MNHAPNRFRVSALLPLLLCSLAWAQAPTEVGRHPREALSVAISPDDRTIATGGNDETILLWPAAGADAPSATLRGHKGAVNGVAFSPDGKSLVAGTQDGPIKVYDSLSLAERASLEGHERPVMGVAIAADGKWIASASQDYSVKRWPMP